MKLFVSSFLLLYLVLSCTQNSFEKDKMAIKEVMEQQSKCWCNGDIDGYMDGYWKSDSLRFLGRRGLTYGWQATRDSYKKSYPDKQSMGKLKFTHISFEPLNGTQMFVVGKWTLEREKDTLRGYYSLLWKKFNGQWKVIFDHSS